jgi:hypothetical protein
VVFLAALVAILLACRRLRQRARIEEARAYLEREGPPSERWDRP